MHEAYIAEGAVECVGYEGTVGVSYGEFNFRNRQGQKISLLPRYGVRNPTINLQPEEQLHSKARDL